MPIHRSIPAKDVPMVKGMLLRNDPQQDIAWYVGVNNSRVNELKKQSTPHARQFADVPPAPPEELPLPGPYPSARTFIERMVIEEMLTAAAIGLAAWQRDIAITVADEAIATLRQELKDEKEFSAEAIANMNAIEAEKNEVLKREHQAWGAFGGQKTRASNAKADEAALRERLAKAAKDTGPRLHAIIDSLHTCRLDGLNAAIEGLHDTIEACLDPFVEFANQPKKRRPESWDKFIKASVEIQTRPNGEAK